MAYSPKPKTCVWFSRHAPTPAQRRSLSAYEIVQVNPPGRAYSAVDAWTLITNRARTPDLIVAVLPLGMLRQLVERANVYAVPVIQASMKALPRDRWEWDGTWNRVLAVRKEVQEWTPDS